MQVDRFSISSIFSKAFGPRMSYGKQDVNTFNSDGRIIQVEYAMKATDLGTTTIGIRLSDAVLLVSEKKLTSPKLQNPTSIKKHFKVFDRVVAGISGISSDAPAIIEKCQDKALTHFKLYNEQISTEQLVDEICSMALKFGEEDDKKIFSRPFGVSFLLASFDDRPKLYSLDPSGSYLEYKARAIGSAQEAIETVLNGEYNPEMEREDAIRWMLQVLKNVTKDPVTSENVDVSVVDASGVSIFTPDQIAEYL